MDSAITGEIEIKSLKVTDENNEEYTAANGRLANSTVIQPETGKPETGMLHAWLPEGTYTFTIDTGKPEWGTNGVITVQGTVKADSNGTTILAYRGDTAVMQDDIDLSKGDITFGVSNGLLTISMTDAEGNVSIDREKIAAYVADLAARRDTYDKSKEFKASDGTWILVSGGSYGWQIDQAAEIEAIFNDLEGSIRETRSPKYARTADSFENCGMGGNYVEVDLTRQHLWMYVDYRLVLQTDFVSGDLTKNHATPSGIYTLYYKESPAVLKSDTPGDSYETPVTYWMPFNGGIGFHDAVWRESFGGVIFQSSGSHGCINMPLDMAALMYENIYAGFPVVCFYR